MNLVSIIIPLYNSEKYIEETILSVCEQTYENIEIHVIDDGSTDSSARIVKNIATKDTRVCYHYQDNAGVSIARNNGINNSKGEYLFFLDSDDIWLPENISVKIDYFKKNPTIDWLFGSIELINENSIKLNKTLKGNDDDILNSLLAWNGEVITTPSSLVIKRKCASSVAFDPILSTAADQDFAIQLAAKYKGGYSKEPNVLYRILPNSMSRNIKLMEIDHIEVFKKAQKNMLFKSFWFKQKCFSNLYWILAGSWWKNGNNKLRGFYFIILALTTNPLSIVKIFNSSKN